MSHDRGSGRRPVLVCASANQHKVAEMVELLGAHVDLRPRPPDVPDVAEDDDTLEGNARLKASAIVAATGEPSVADDTGLEVDALGGAPGVHSHRFAGPDACDADNRARLLALLDGLPVPERTARFRTVALVRFPDGRELIAEGVCEGVISLTERGSRGFGYDAMFVPVGADGSTFAEMDAETKHAISHRGRALRALVELLGDHLAVER